MPHGPGKYDDICTLAREQTNAQATILVIMDGYRGSGFSVQSTDPTIAKRLPSILREVADGIEADNKEAESYGQKEV